MNLGEVCVAWARISLQYRTAAAGRARWQQIDVCVVPTDSHCDGPGGCWTVHFDSHVQHYSDWRHKHLCGSKFHR